MMMNQHSSTWIIIVESHERVLTLSMELITFDCCSFSSNIFQHDTLKCNSHFFLEQNFHICFLFGLCSVTYLYLWGTCTTCTYPLPFPASPPMRYDICSAVKIQHTNILQKEMEELYIHSFNFLSIFHKMASGIHKKSSANLLKYWKKKKWFERMEQLDNFFFVCLAFEVHHT